MPHVRGFRPFKMDFVCVSLMLGNGKPLRAAVISVAEIKSPTHIMAAVVLENGVIQQMPIRRDLFLAAQVANNVVTMVEAPDQGSGELTLFGANGKRLTWNRDDSISINTK